MQFRRVLCRIADERGIAGGATVFPDHFVVEPRRDEPTRRHNALAGPRTALDQRQLLRGGERPVRGIKAHLQKLQQIVRRRTQRAGSGEHRKFPVSDRRKSHVVASRQPLPHRIRKRHAGVVHAERRANPRDDKLLVAPAGAQLEHMTEQAEAEIGVFDSACPA